MSNLKRWLSLLLTLVFMFNLLPAAAFATTAVAAEGVAIDEVNFPDKAFRAAVCELEAELSPAPDDFLSGDELAQVTALYVSDRGISDMTGIAYFTELTVLDCSYNNLGYLDVSSLTKLTELVCNNNQMYCLDVCPDTWSFSLAAYENVALVNAVDGVVDLAALPGMDASKIFLADGGTVKGTDLYLDDPTAESAVVRYGYMANLVVSLDCTLSVTNQVTGGGDLGGGDLGGGGAVAPAPDIAIDEAHFPDPIFRDEIRWYDDGDGYLSEEERNSITELRFNDCELADLTGIEYLKNLEYLISTYTDLTSLDLSANTKLIGVDVGDNEQLAQIKLPGNEALEILYCDYCDLTQLDLTGCTGLRELDCGSNRIYKLDVTGCSELIELYCERNCLTKLDLSGNPLLETLYGYENYLTSLDISCCPQLLYPSVRGNVFELMHVGGVIDLTTLPEGFDITKANDWIGGVVTGTKLKVDVGVTQATYVYDCGNDYLETFTLKFQVYDGESVRIDADNFPDEVLRNYVLQNFDKDGDGVLSGLEASKGTFIGLYGAGVADLTGIQHFPQLKTLTVSNNQLACADVSQNPALKTFNCTGNKRSVVLDEGTLDLAAINGFDVSKASDWTGGTVSGSILTVEEGVNTVTYTYDCGRGYSNTFTLSFDPYYEPAAVSAENFPDPIFCAYVSDKFDLDKDGMLRSDEVAQAKTVAMSDVALADLTGLEHLPALTDLYVPNCQLTTLDISGNPMITDVDVSNNRLTKIISENNKNLFSFECENNQLTGFKLTDWGLAQLNCSGNPLTWLKTGGRITNFYHGTLPYMIDPEGNTFDLTTLPEGFDVSKTSNWVGGTVEGNILTIDEGVSEITYTYQCSWDREATFTLSAHKFSEWTVDTPATCTTDGSESRTCSDCGKVDTRVIAAYGHEYQVFGTPATCTEDGYETSACWRCGDTDGIIIDLPALGHDYENSEWICTDTTHQHACNRCHELTEPQPHENDALMSGYCAICSYKLPIVTILGGGVLGGALTVHGPEGGWVEGENTFTVASEEPCMVAVSKDGGLTYTVVLVDELTATGAEFVVDLEPGYILAVTPKGDVNNDGKVSVADIAKLKAYQLGKTELDGLGLLISNINSDDKISVADIAKLKAVQLGKSSLEW